MKPLLTACRLLFALVPAAACAAGGIDFEDGRLSQRAEHGAAELVYVFRFVNKSGGPVALEHVEEGCGCLKGKGLFESVAAGEEGEIRGVMDLKGLHGTVAKSMWLRFTNGERHELVAEAVVPATLVIEPTDLAWRRGDEPEARQVAIRIEAGPPLEVTDVVSNLPRFSLRLETVEAGRHYLLHVTPGATDKEEAAVIQVRTSSKEPRDALRAVFASVTETRSANP
jgi:hypothetical protein